MKIKAMDWATKRAIKERFGRYLVFGCWMLWYPMCAIVLLIAGIVQAIHVLIYGIGAAITSIFNAIYYKKNVDETMENLVDNIGDGFIKMANKLLDL